MEQALVEVIERLRDAVASGFDIGAALVDLAPARVRWPTAGGCSRCCARCPRG